MLKTVTNHLKKGGIIVYPTETAYGLGCDATNQKAVNVVFKIKNRKKSKTLPLIVGSVKMVKKYCTVSVLEEGLIKKYWPGALTLVLGVKKNILPRLAIGCVAKDKTVAIRVSKNKMAQLISLKLDQPIVSTSANLSGKKECYSIAEVVKNLCPNQVKCQLEKSILLVDGGRLKKQKPSTIVRVEENGWLKVLRKGEIKFL